MPLPRIVIGLTLLLGLGGCATHYQHHDERLVHLFLRRPDARSVYLATSLDGFRPRPASARGGGLWESVLPADREFTYFYLLDGEVFVPACACREVDDFGSVNCIYTPSPQG